MRRSVMHLPFWGFLAAEDAGRVSRTLQTLFRHDVGRWALAGGLAVELHWTRLTGEVSVRALNDLDFIVDSFDALPESLADDFLFWHIHPFDPPGKTLVQLVDPDGAVRIDVFRAYGGETSRCEELTLSTGVLRLVSIEDLAARTARLALDLATNQPVPAVHALDFIRFTKWVDPAQVEPIWPDHRKSQHPKSFNEAYRLLTHLIPARQDLLLTREYSKEVTRVCPRCKETTALRLADARVVLSLLGYC
jgi:hypothetical protein